MKSKGLQKKYKNKNSNPIFDYEKETNTKPKKNKKRDKNTNPDNGFDVNEEYFIGMKEDTTNYENNREVIKKIKKQNLINSNKQNKNNKKLNKTSKNNIDNNINNKQQKKKDKIEKEKEKKLKELNKKLIKEKRKRNKEIKKVEKEEAKKRKKEEIIHLNQKELRKRRIKKLSIKYSFIFVLLIFAIILFLLSPVFYVKNIEIEGNSKISNEEIKSLLQINSTTNIFEESNKKVNEKLKENKYIESVYVKKILPSTIRVTITERQVEYLLEYANSFVYVDKNGNILEISTKDIEQKVKILGYISKSLNEQDKLNDEDIKKLKDVQKILQSAQQFGIRDKITSINISDENDYQIYMQNESKIVHLGNIENIDTKMLYIKAITEKEKGNDGEIFVNMDLNKKQPYFRQNV